MNSLLLVLGSIVLFVIAYMTYGSWLGKQWGVDEKIPTPAHTMMDGVDYVPSKPQVLLRTPFLHRLREQVPSQARSKRRSSVGSLLSCGSL